MAVTQIRSRPEPLGFPSVLKWLYCPVEAGTDNLRRLFLPDPESAINPLVFGCGIERPYAKARSNNLCCCFFPDPEWACQGRRSWVAICLCSPTELRTYAMQHLFFPDPE